MKRRLLTAAWIAWGLLFCLFEALGARVPGGTLSEHIWWLLGLHPILWFLGAGFLGWTVLHFLSGGHLDDLIARMLRRR
jgi:hypothetical protein